MTDHDPAHLTAATGRAHRQAGHHTAARAALAAALDRLPAAARRVRVLALTDLAMAELDAGDLAEACCHATTAAAGLFHRAPYATGTARLRAFRAAAARPSASRAARPRRTPRPPRRLT